MPKFGNPESSTQCVTVAWHPVTRFRVLYITNQCIAFTLGYPLLWLIVLELNSNFSFRYQLLDIVLIGNNTRWFKMIISPVLWTRGKALVRSFMLSFKEYSDHWNFYLYCGRKKSFFANFVAFICSCPIEVTLNDLQWHVFTLTAMLVLHYHANHVISKGVNNLKLGDFDFFLIISSFSKI